MDQAKKLSRSRRMRQDSWGLAFLLLAAAGLAAAFAAVLFAQS